MLVVLPTDVVRCIQISLKLWTSSVTQGHLHNTRSKSRQRFYDHVLGNSLNGAANLRQEAYARLSDKEGIEKKIHNLLYLKPR
nr:embryogenesis-associated protein EMB8-like [Tanacetum cinerariifolium]